MPNPSFAEYTDALKLDLGIVLSDPLLGRGTLRTHEPGQPVVLSGNFALTFEIVADGKKFAVRCFHKQSDSLQARYDAISEHLRRIRSPYFVEFEFQPSGITTESGTYPIVRMEWADGQSLAGFVSDHRNDVNALQQLRVTLHRLAQHLRDSGIAHGDIQPSNVIVQSASSLKLIDYDGMFVPELGSLLSAELGQRNFQHPGRRPGHFDENLDAFSFSVIDLALDALCKRPDLWDLTASGDDAFILRAADFADPATSPVFSLLSRLPGLERRTQDLAAICLSPFRWIPSFEDFLAGRGVPAMTVVFAGDAAAALRRPYVSPHDIVDAADFARCCAHVGDRVELIGRIAHVARSPAPKPDTGPLRVEFGERSHDVVCLNIWPDALARLNDVPDESWAGQWVSAVGLIEPVSTVSGGAQHQKIVSISITEQSQLQKLTEAEAQHRLRGHGGRGGDSLDKTGGVATDPVVPDMAPRRTVSRTRRPEEATRPATRPVPRPQSPPQPLLSPPPAPAMAPPSPARTAHPAPRVAIGAASAPRNRHVTWWFAAAVIVAVVAYTVISTWWSHEPAQEGRRAGEAVQSADDAHAGQTAAPASVAPNAQRPVPARAAVELKSQQSLRNARLPIETSSGRLGIGTLDGPVRVLILDGKTVPKLRDDTIVLAHRAVFSDREVVVGFTQCNGTAAPCGLRKPFWLELRDGFSPDVRQLDGLWASSGAVSVSATSRGVRIELGLWNGERRVATLTTAGDIEVSRTREPRRALSRSDCGVVAESLDACASSRDCRSFASSARPMSRPQRTRLTRIYHESTGLDAPAFRGLCIRSCQLGLTPSRDFIRRSACSGARAGQWPPGNPAAGLLERGG